MDENSLPATGTDEQPCASARDEVRRQLFRTYGPLLTREQIVRILGFRTAEALERSVERGQIALRVIRIPHRQGLFARTSDLIDYLDSLDQHVIQRKERKTGQ
jgi:hypothetical protein